MNNVLDYDQVCAVLSDGNGVLMIGAECSAHFLALGCRELY